jgi:hypothetical protein
LVSKNEVAVLKYLHTPHTQRGCDTRSMQPELQFIPEAYGLN